MQGTCKEKVTHQAGSLPALPAHSLLLLTPFPASDGVRFPCKGSGCACTAPTARASNIQHLTTLLCNKEIKK